MEMQHTTGHIFGLHEVSGDFLFLLSNHVSDNQRKQFMSKQHETCRSHYKNLDKNIWPM